MMDEKKDKTLEESENGGTMSENNPAKTESELTIKENFRRIDEELATRIKALRAQAEEDKKNAPDDGARIDAKLESAIAAEKKTAEKEKYRISEEARKREADIRKAAADAALVQKIAAVKAEQQRAYEEVDAKVADMASIDEDAKESEMKEIREMAHDAHAKAVSEAKAQKQHIDQQAKAEIQELKRATEREKRIIDLTTVSVLEQQKIDQNAACVASNDFTDFDDDVQRGMEIRKRELAILQDNDTPPDENALLEVRHLKMYFPLKKSLSGKVLVALRAVDDVSFTLKEGETLGIVGESGCGKTTMGRAILKLYKPTGGQIFFGGKDIAPYTSSEMRPLRTQMQIIFQDPYSSLPPRSTVGGILSEPVRVHNIVPKEKTKEYVLDVMDQCGLRDYYFERYPHEFSGGQRQRICIARALSVNPKLVVCDEPVSALDVSIQAQIINLLKRLQKQRGLTYVFISHDLSVVKHISDKIGVMYLGSMVEFGDKKSIFSNPMHPYTQALFSAVPNPNPDVKMDRIVLKGDIPSPANPPKGCKFHTRCPKCMEICKHVAPVYKEYEPGHFVACHCYPQEEA